MAVTVQAFYETFPEFSPYQFQDAAVQFWLDAAAVFINQRVWGAPAAANQPFTPFDYGVLFYAAHNIATGLQAVGQVGPSTTPEGAATGAPGLSVGVTNHKQVDKVSISYDVASIAEEAAGHWNATTYGRKFARMARQFGSAPMFIGAGPTGFAPQAWAGPGYPFPGWFAW